MYHFILFFFTTTFASYDFDNVSKSLFVSHYDCTKMQDNRMYSLNKVADCRTHLRILYVTRLPSHSIRRTTGLTWQQQCVLSRPMFSAKIVECFHIRPTFILKIV